MAPFIAKPAGLSAHAGPEGHALGLLNHTTSCDSHKRSIQHLASSGFKGMLGMLVPSLSAVRIVWRGRNACRSSTS